jgi:hypothetical protein
MSFRALLSFDEVERGAHPVCERCEVLVKALQNAKYRLDYAMSRCPPWVPRNRTCFMRLYLKPKVCVWTAGPSESKWNTTKQCTSYYQCRNSFAAEYLEEDGPHRYLFRDASPAPEPQSWPISNIKMIESRGYCAENPLGFVAPPCQDKETEHQHRSAPRGPPSPARPLSPVDQSRRPDLPIAVSLLGLCRPSI